jgi:predicted nucleotide-binding protein (sugar kinase/HSP70/actin superfamily)
MKSFWQYDVFGIDIEVFGCGADSLRNQLFTDRMAEATA